MSCGIGVVSRAAACALALALAGCGAGIGAADEDDAPPPMVPGAAGRGGASGQGGAPEPGDGVRPDGGSRAAAPDGSSGPPPAPGPGIAAPRVAISEIMYHPVLATADDNAFEFVELHNPGTQAVALGGWKLAGDVQYTFPAGTTIGPGKYLVVARNRARLLGLGRYDLMPLAAQVLGDFAGALDDGGGRLALLDAAGAPVDQAAWRDEFPWPLAADAFGAGDGWFGEAEWFPASDPRRDFAAHRGLGHSLERVSFAVPATEPSNWVPSPLDGATPGRPGSISGTPPAIVEELAVSPERDPTARVLRAGDKVLVRARLTAGAPADHVELEYHVAFERGRRVASPARTKVAMTPGPAGHQALLPAFPERSVIRYRVTAERRPGAREVLSPRPTDPIPHGHHLFWVGAAVSGKPHYEILIAPEAWGRMWSNISPNGAVMGCPCGYLDAPCRGCMENPAWNARVPAVFVAGGEAYDVRTRYHGSMEGRTAGVDITTWPADAPRPTAGPLRALSWSVAFPRYRRFEKQSRLILNRLYQSCPGFSTFVAAQLFEDERGGAIPAPRVRRWARLFVNGVPYNYVMDLEPIGEEYLERFHGPRQPVGEVFKVDSTGDDLGPWAPGNGRPILASPWCPGIPVKARYQRTYSRQTYEWRPADEVIALVDGLARARAQGPGPLREYLLRNFDVDRTLKYYAVQQWGAPWDDNGKNYNLYKLPAGAQRAGRGAWTITSWDVDRMFGVMWCGRDGCRRADIPIYCGTGTMGEAKLPVCNAWKRAFLEALRPEYDAKLRELNESVLRPDNVRRIVGEALAGYDAAEARQMLARPVCDAAAEAANVRTFAERRHQAVKAQLGY